MRTFLTALILLFSVYVHAQFRSMRINNVVEHLNTKHQNNTQNNQYQRGVSAYKQFRSMRINNAVEHLNTELQNNAQDNQYQRRVRFRVTVNSDSKITIQQTWQNYNGSEDQMLLSFYPRDIIDVDKAYHKNTMALAIACKQNTVENHWMQTIHRNDSVDIPCLKSDAVAIARIEETFLYLKELTTR